MTDTETRELLPDVKTYLAAVEAALQAFREAESALGDKYPQRGEYTDEGREQRRKHYDELGAASDAHDAASQAAWDVLKTSSDPLVKWIAEKAGGYQNQAAQVLNVLPATLEELDALAGEHEWCGTWTALRDRAIAAGVMPGYVPPSAAVKAVLEAIDDEACCRFEASSMNRIRRLLDAVADEAKGEQVAA